MRIPGQTPLSATALPTDQIGLFRSLWIETVEEAIALGAAVSGSSQDIPALATLAKFSGDLTASVPQDRLSILQKFYKGGGLGCLLDPHAVDAYRRDGRLRLQRSLPTGAFETPLPHSIRMFDRMPSVRDQGERGTCVAFASVAMREFLLSQPNELSEQYLYWACKELDGLSDSGTFIHTAMTAFAQYGICKRNIWPYNPKQETSEGQGPPPRGVLEDAQSFRLPSARTVEPGLVLHYKQVLAGESSKGGMPVVFGVLVFNSWYMSSETHRTGKITLPLPGEQPVGGHAMCVIGYVDDDAVPGGGYFIVRNSWGTKWASESPEAPGHALMPYDYVERFAMEAFTGPTAGIKTDVPTISAEWREYIRILDSDARDLDGRLHKKGTAVLAHPSHPDAFQQDTPENRLVFLRLHRAWTPDVRAAAWFPLKTSWPDAFRKAISLTHSAKQAFLAAIDENLKTAVGTVFPDVNQPSFASLMPWQARIRHISEEADLSSDLATALLGTSGVPPEVAPTKEWADTVLSVNFLRIFRLRSIPADIRVVSAFVSPLALCLDGLPTFGKPSSAVMQAVRDLVARHESAVPGRKPVYTFFTLSAAVPWPDELKGIAAGDHSILLSHRDGNGVWHTLAPSSFVKRVSFRNFVDRLYPITAEDRVIRIKSIVDRKFAEGYEAYITVEKIADETHFRKTTVRDAFLAMQEHGKDDYIVERLDDGRVIVRPRRTGERIKLTTASFKKGFLRKHCLLFLSAGVGVSGWIARDWLVKRYILTSADFVGILILIALVYLTGLVQTQINRRASEEKES